MEILSDPYFHFFHVISYLIVSYLIVRLLFLKIDSERIIFKLNFNYESNTLKILTMKVNIFLL